MLLLKHPTGQITVKDQTIKQMNSLLAPKKLFVCSTTNHKGWAWNCTRPDTKRQTSTSDLNQITVASRNWWKQTIIPTLPWKSHLFRCFNTLRGGKPRGSHTSCPKQGKSLLSKQGMKFSLQFLTELKNAMWFTSATTISGLHLLQPSWAMLSARA